MKIHKEGVFTILLVMILGLTGSILSFLFLPTAVTTIVIVLYVFVQSIVTYFFRNPLDRIPVVMDAAVVAPADGTVVAIEKVMESEYFKEEKLQISIFMSVFNVHKNFHPVSGEVVYYKHHNGNFHRAILPKSSTENERSTVVVKNESGEVLFRQIAGAMARRIVTYVKEKQHVEQASEAGFIKFGSRVDVFLPIDTIVNVQLGDKTVGSQTIIAMLR